MMSAIWIAAGMLLAVFIVWRLLVPSMDKIVDRAVADKDVSAVVEAIGKQRAAVQPTLYNHAIRRLWDAYERPLATELVRELAQRHHTTNIAQYWLKQVLTAEPGLAKGVLTKSFFDTYYIPELAAKCGPVG